jgi:hypothetical protein
MALTPFSRPGQVNSAGDARALNLELFAGEVMSAFSRKTVMMPLMRNKTIPHGKSASFPATGRAVPSFYTAGDSIIDDSYLSAIASVKRKVDVDYKMINTTFLDQSEDDLNEYEIRSEYAKQLGEGLAVEYDRLALVMLARAARTNATTDPDKCVTDLGTLGHGGYIQYPGTPTPQELYEAFEAAAAEMDAKDVPKESRYLPLLPGDYWYIMRFRDIINRDYGGTAILTEGNVTRMAGATVVVTNNLPTSDFTTASYGTAVTGGNAYVGEFSATGIGSASRSGYLTTMFHTDAISAVWIRGMQVEMEYDIEYQGDLMVAKLQKGINVTRPESAVEINSLPAQPDLTTVTP